MCLFMFPDKKLRYPLFFFFDYNDKINYNEEGAIMKLEEIENPKFLKKLNNDELKKLSSDIRNYLIKKVSKTGGHLSSNLGIVELTIMIHKVFNSPKDKIVFDVSHQSYVHKILTGRAKEFDNLRKINGISGFTKMNESIYDAYEAGHSSTSLSAALGLALGRDMNGKKNNVIAVIGDASIGNGLAYEALNQIGTSKTKLIIILNDNNMSISKNVGALHNHLDKLRSKKGYLNVKDKTKKILNKTKIGMNISFKLKNIKESIKKMYMKDGFVFEEFGIDYYGPINGHDFEELELYLNIAKRSRRPVLIHVITEKGKGYKFAEEDTNGIYHGVSSFDPSVGILTTSNDELMSWSEVVTNSLIRQMEKDIIAITPAMANGSKLTKFSKLYPKNFIDVGIAEEHAVVLANGLSLEKKIPIVFIYSSFLQRAYDEVLHDVARMNSHVILCIDRCGIVGEDGETHQGLFDVPMLLPIPNMVISMPSSPKEADNLLELALKTNKPFVIRYPKINLKYDFQKKEDIVLGSWSVLASGEDGVIITYGDFVSRAQNICEKLSKDSINLTIINARFLKPIDEKMLSKILKYYKKVFIYEESMEGCSLDSVVLSFASKINSKNDFYIYNIPNKFMFTATREELIKLNNLDEESIYNKIKKEYKN